MCGKCGRVRRIAKRATENHPDLCPACHWSPTATCTICGDHDGCFGVRKGTPVCHRCRALDRIRDIVTQPGGTPHPQLAGLVDVFASTPNPRSLLTWLEKSPTITLLQEIAQGGVKLDHESLDVRPQTPSLRHARALLTAIGSLPARDPHLANLELGISRVIEQAPARHRPALRSFARWHVINRVRRRHPDRMVGAHVAKNAKSQVQEAARFLAWLEHNETTLETLSQGHADAYIADRPQARNTIRALLARVGSHAEVASSPRGSLTIAIDHNRRWALAQRLLNETDIDTPDRVAGCLVLLYAQPVSRIATFCRDDVSTAEGATYLALSKEPVLMPEPLGGLLRELPSRRQTGLSGTAPASQDWLFPGRNAGTHQHPEYIRTRLKRLGVDCRANRNAALLQLASELPPVVIASLLGIHPNTAVRWSQAAGADWTRYAARKVHSAATSGAAG